MFKFLQAERFRYPSESLIRNDKKLSVDFKGATNSFTIQKAPHEELFHNTFSRFFFSIDR
ncbi:MAG: hypothetical protein ACI8PP_001855 [Candidatus Pseudothioglobus sp.]|jgi:hypothetical protein